METRRTKISLLAAPVLGALFLAGCSSPSAEEPEGAADGSQGAGEPVTLLLPSGNFERTMLPMLEEFTAETGIEVEPIAMPAEDARSRQILDLNNQTGELDLILLDAMPWLSQVVTHLEPLESAEGDETYFEPLMDMFTIDGERYASPLGVSIRTIIYRTDIFDEAGLEPPTTYEELYETAEALTTEEMFGFVGPYGRATSHVSVWVLAAYNHGLESVIDESGETVAFNNDAGVGALESLASLYRDGLMPVDSIEFAHDGTLVAMQEGRAAMTILPTSFMLSLNDPEATEFAGTFEIAPMPTEGGTGDPAALATGWGFALSKYTDNRDNAEALLTFLDEQIIVPTEEATPEQLVRPVSEAAFEHPGTEEIFPNGQMDLLRESLLNAKTLPATPLWDEIQNALGEEFQRAYLGEITAEEAIANAETRANEILAES